MNAVVVGFAAYHPAAHDSSAVCYDNNTALDDGRRLKNLAFVAVIVSLTDQKQIICWSFCMVSELAMIEIYFSNLF